MASVSETARPDAPRIRGRLGFRTEIEGLRGVAVLLVVLYHATFPWIEGGYVGVDVFFVISGYLITRLLLKEFEAGTFSARNFYVRRIRRLIPALLATIIVSIAAGILILSPQHLNELGSSSIFAALSLSNVYFALSDGYFETSSKIKPLLHTWSLSVEEQFYLVWPFTLWVLFAVAALRRHLFAVIAVLLVASLVLSEIWIDLNPSHAYFLSPFRAYQLLAGAMAVWAERHVARLGSPSASALVLAGLALVAASAFIFDEASPFPGLNGLVPALGGFLVVAAGGHAPLPSRLLSIAPLTALGRISYSVYLAHWPIVVYARYLSVDPFTTLEKLLLCLASVAGGWVLFHGVEARFRVSGAGKGAGHTWREATGVAVVCVATLGVAAGLRGAEGLPQRMNLAPENREMAAQSGFEFLEDYSNGFISRGTRKNGLKVLILGDSMMQNYVPAIMEIPGIAAADVHIATRGGCPMAAKSLQIVFGGVDENCRWMRNRLYYGDTSYDLVLWGQSWMEYEDRLYRETEGGPVQVKGDGLARWRDLILDTEAALGPRTGRLVVFGPQVTVDNVPPVLERIGPLTDIEAIPSKFAAISERDPEARDRFAADLKALLPDAIHVDPDDLVCPNDACQFFEGPISYYFDPIHHTAAMTPILAERIAPALAGALP